MTTRIKEDKMQIIIDKLRKNAHLHVTRECVRFVKWC